LRRGHIRLGHGRQARFIDKIERALVLDSVVLKVARITPVPPLAFLTVSPIL
jgi:hypothetical protein